MIHLGSALRTAKPSTLLTPILRNVSSSPQTSDWVEIPAPNASTQRPDVLSLSPQAFVDTLKSQNISAFHIAFDSSSKKFNLSHAFLQPIASYFLHNDPIQQDFDNHEAIFIRISPQGVLQSAAIQRTFRGAAAGGVRNWTYENVEAFLRDGMRLAKGMGSKNALAGLWWGGGKGVMARNTGIGLDDSYLNSAERAKVYHSYGTFMSALRGCYVTAEDVGTNVEDMAQIHSHTRHTTCVPERLGGSGNPSIPTAKGIVTGIQAAFEELGMEIKGSRVGVIGLGNVGSYVCRYLIEKGVGEIIGTFHNFTLNAFAHANTPAAFANQQPRTSTPQRSPPFARL